MKLTNRWNQLIYSLWAPVYDSTINRFFMPGRVKAMQLLALQPGESVLLVGVGTGVDLLLLPDGVQAIGIDLSRRMLAKAKQKLPRSPASVALIQGDAQTQNMKTNAFDAVLLNLILSVVPDGRACLQSTLLALKPGGRAVIFDKFLPERGELTFQRRLINFFSSFFGTDITRRFSDLNAGGYCMVVKDEPGIFRGFYRVMLVQKAPVAR